MSELKFKMGTKSSATPTSGNIGEVFFTTDENKYGHIYFVDKMKKIINIVPKLLEVKFGGTGKTTNTLNSVLVGNATNAIKNIQSLDGAFYATGTNDEPQFGTLPVEQGGTGSTSQTANRIIYTSNASTIASSGHYASSNKIAINSTTAPSGAFHVNGISTFAAPSNGHGHLYFTGAVANSSTSNKTQLVFGTSSDNHLAISSNTKALVLNPTTASTSNQIVLYLEQASLFPGGISINSVVNADGTVKKGNLSVAGNAAVGGTISAGSHLSAGGDLTISGNGSIDGDFTVDGDGTIKNSLIVENGAVISGRPYGTGDDEGIIVLPAENSYAGISLGSHNGARTTLYLMPSSVGHRSVWRYCDGTNTYNITHPETNGEIVVHTADTAQGSETLPVYVAASGVVTPCTASSVFSDFSSTAGASGETLSITVAGQTRTVTLDAANESQGGVITTGTQTIAGQKTFNGTIYSSKIAPREDMNTNYLLGDTSNTWYNIYSRSLSLYDGTNGKSGGQIYTAVSNATTAQTTVVELGNSTATGTAGNRYGVLRLYNEGSTYLNLVSYRYATDSTTTAATSRTVYLRDHGATAYLAATTTRSAVGSEVQPVYVTNSGVLTACKMTTSGKWFNALPVILSDGVMEIGRYIDFHSTNATTSDYSIRIDAGTGSQSNTLYLPDLSGQVVIHTNDTAEGSASLPVYIAASGQATACTAGSVFSDFSSTAGTTKGETLSITVATKTRTLVLDHATDSQSGVVTTGAQTFAGNKTLYGNFVVTNSDSTSTTARSISATTANGSVGIQQSTNRGLYDFTKDGWIIYSDTSNSNATTIPTRLHTPYLTITSTSSGEHIKFSRAGYNYITYPSGGTVAINCGSSLGEGYAQLLINESSVRSGTEASLGTSGNRWSYVYGRNFHAKNSGASTSNACFTVENYDGSCSISLLYGSGQSNTGIYDNVNAQWMIYRALGDDTELKRKTTRIPGGIAFTSSHGTGTPGAGTAGYGVTGAVYFKRV